MEKLLDAIAAVVFLVSPDKVQAIAGRIRRTEANKAATALAGVVGTPVASGVVDQLIQAWCATSVSAEELASMLLAAVHVFTKASNEQSAELVWTGPTTPSIASAGLSPLFGNFFGTIDVSDFSTAWMARLRSLTFPAPSGVPPPDTVEISLLPYEKLPGMLRVIVRVGSVHGLRLASCTVLPSALLHGVGIPKL
jgi:hypothetical protein